MFVTLRAAGLSWLSLVLATRQAMAIDNCADLLTAVATATTATTITLEADVTDCLISIEILASQVITIEGEYTLGISAGFSSSTASTGGSLFVNEGNLTLSGITFTTSTVDANRAVWNQGSLSIVGCSFSLFADGGILSKGGVIYSDSSAEIVITDSTFSSNLVTDNGGAIYATGSETLSIIGTVFRNNEVGTGGDELGAGGDIYAGRNVDLTVANTWFTGSTAEFGGAAIECCGAAITNSTFTGTDSSSTSEHFGAVLVGRRDEEACTKEFTLVESKFSECSVGYEVGAGGSLAIFDTTAHIEDSEFEFSVGTALLFESSSSTGEHLLEMTTVQFNENSLPAEMFTADSSQGTAVVLVNSAVSDSDDTVVMGEFFNTYCFANVPYECEFVYDGAEITHEGEFKCQLCDIEGERQASVTDDDVSATDSATSSSDNLGSTSSYIITGIAGALAMGLTIAFVCIVVRRCKKSARPDETHTTPAAAPAAPSLPAATGHSSAAGGPATAGTVEPTVPA